MYLIRNIQNKELQLNNKELKNGQMAFQKKIHKSPKENRCSKSVAIQEMHKNYNEITTSQPLGWLL